MTQITFDPIALGAEVGSFKSACVRAENASTPFARKALAGILTNGIDETGITVLLLNAFKPKRPKDGKLADKLSGLRYAVGGDAARKAAEKVFAVAKSASVYETVKPLVVAFVLESEGAAKSLNALDMLVKAEVAKVLEGQGASDAANDADDTTAEENGEAPVAPIAPVIDDIGDMSNRLILALEGADVAALIAAQDRLNALFAAIADASVRIADLDEQREAA